MLLLNNIIPLNVIMPRKAANKRSTPKKGKKANQTTPKGTIPDEVARRASSPTATGLTGGDDAIIEQVLENQGAIGELVKKTSTIEGSVSRILQLLEGGKAEGYNEKSRGRGSSGTEVRGQSRSSPW